MGATLQTIGEWDSAVGVPLDRAIAASMQVMGRTAFDATKQAVILMAQSARAITPQSRARRGVVKGTSKMGEYVLDYTKADKRGGVPLKTYRFFFGQEFNANDLRDGKLKMAALAARRRFQTFDAAKRIRMRGLAKASWMWPLRMLSFVGPVQQHKDRHRVGYAGSFQSKANNEAGHYLNNGLSYILKIMPSNWESEVQRKAGNKMMAQARSRLQRDFQSSMRRASSVGASAIRGVLR